MGTEARNAGHATVTGVQAASAAIREMEGNFTNNIRAVERFLTTIPGLSTALKAAFPVVGAIAFGSLIAEQVIKVRDFIKAMNKMPEEIRNSFRDMHTSLQMANDELRIVNDRLENDISKLEGKPQNNLALMLDETRIMADRLSKSLSEDSRKVKELLEHNSNGIFAQFFGKGSTAEVAGSINSFRSQMSDLAFAKADAAHRGDLAAADKAQSDLTAKQKAYADWIDAQIKMRTGTVRTEMNPVEGVHELNPQMVDVPYAQVNGDQSANLEFLRGERRNLFDRDDQEAIQSRNSSLEAKRSALEAQRAGASERLQQMEEELNQLKMARGESIKADYQYWGDRIATFSAGSSQYNSIVAKMSELAVQGARQAAETIKKFREGQRRPDADSDTQIAAILARNAEEHHREAVRNFSLGAQFDIDRDQLDILKANNDAREREAQLLNQAGVSMTQYATAVEMASVHQEEFAQTLKSLQAIQNTRQLLFNADPTRENARGLAEAQTAIAHAVSQRQIQGVNDMQAIYGRQTSAIVGATDALDEFVKATRDSSGQMLAFVDGTIQGLNQNIIRGISGQRTSFGSFGADMFRGLAGIGLSKAEGSILGVFGLGGGKKPTGAPGDALHVIVDNAATGGGSAAVPFTGLLPGGGGMGSIASTALSFLPGFANGGAIDSGTWPVIGERGPELFYSGGGGSIVPNDKIGGGSGDMHFHIDARGATDPAQTEAAIHRAMASYAPKIAAMAVHGVHEQRQRTPGTRR
jgi:lambda family phage tail tape measure protein